MKRDCTSWKRTTGSTRLELGYGKTNHADSARVRPNCPPFDRPHSADSPGKERQFVYRILSPTIAIGIYWELPFRSAECGHSSAILMGFLCKWRHWDSIRKFVFPFLAGRLRWVWPPLNALSKYAKLCLLLYLMMGTTSVKNCNVPDLFLVWAVASGFNDVKIE